MNGLMSFIRGFGSLLDIFGTSLDLQTEKRYTKDSILNRTDEEAFREDWENIRGDFEKVIGKW